MQKPSRGSSSNSSSSSSNSSSSSSNSSSSSTRCPTVEAASHTATPNAADREAAKLDGGSHPRAEEAAAPAAAAAAAGFGGDAAQARRRLAPRRVDVGCPSAVDIEAPNAAAAAAVHQEAAAVAAAASANSSSNNSSSSGVHGSLFALSIQQTVDAAAAAAAAADGSFPVSSNELLTSADRPPPPLKLLKDTGIGSQRSCRQIGFSRLRTFDKINEALKLSEAEEKELLEIAQQQQQQLPGMQRGRWLQAWVEPSGASPPLQGAAAVAAAATAAGAPEMLPLSVPQAYYAVGAAAPTRPAPHPAAAAAAAVAERVCAKPAAAAAAPAAAAAAAGGDLWVVEVVAESVQRQAAAAAPVRRIRIPAGAFRPLGQQEKGRRSVCLRFAGAAATGAAAAPSSGDGEQQQGQLQRQQQQAAAADAASVQQQQKLALLRFLCLLEQQILRWCCCTSLQHYALTCHPEALQAAAAAAGSSSPAAAARATAAEGHVPFWDYVLEVKPPEMPLEEFVVWCQRPVGMPVSQYLQLLQLAAKAKESSVSPPAAAAAGAAAAAAAGSLVLLGGIVSHCQEATDAVGCLLGECEAFDKRLRGLLRQQKKVQRQHAVHRKLETTMRRNFFSLAPKYLRLVRSGACFLHAQESVLHGRRLNLLQWQGDTAAAASAAGEEGGMLHELRCCSSEGSSSSSSRSRCRVLRMQGLVGQEFAADCEAILPRAREALHRWRLRQQQQQQPEQQQQQQQQQDARSGEEQFYAQALQDLLMRSAALASEQEGRDRRQAAAEIGLFPPSPSYIPSGFALWRCMGLSGHGVLWQLLHEETVDLSLLKLQSLSPTALAAIAAAGEPHQQQPQQQQQQQQQQKQVERGLLLVKQRVASALQQLQQLREAARGSIIFATHAAVKGMHFIEVTPFFECASLEELLRSGASYNSSGGLQRAQQLAIQLAVAVVSLGSVCFLLPLKLSKVFVNGHRIILVAGLPLSLLLLPAAAAAAAPAAAAPAAAAAESAANDANPKASAASTSSAAPTAAATGLEAAATPREQPAGPSSTAAATAPAAAAVVDSLELSWNLVSSLREATAATELWAEDLCCCLPPECMYTSVDLCRSPEAVDKAHAWMLGLLLLRICLGVDRAGKQRMWSQEPQQQIEAAVRQVEAEDAQEFLRVCLQRDPAKRPSLSTLVRSHSYLQQQQTAAAAAAGAQNLEASEVATPPKPRRSRRRLQAAAAAASNPAEADLSAAAAAAASPPSTAAELSVGRSFAKKRRLGPQLGEAAMSGVRAPKKPAAAAAAGAATAEGGRSSKQTPSLLPPLVGSRLQQQLQQHPAAATAAATRLLDCCDALFGDVGLLVPALIKEGKRRRQRGEEGVAFYRQNDPLALDSMPPQSLPQSQTESPTAAAAAAAAASAGRTAAAAAAALRQQQTTRLNTS